MSTAGATGEGGPPINATAASLLGFLHAGEQTGWELAREVERTIGAFWNVTRSQVYRELRTLEELGLVTAGDIGARDRRPYAITDAGRVAFTAWIARPPGDDVVRSPLLMTVFFGGHLEEPVLRRFLALHRARHQQRLADYEVLHAVVAGQEPMRWVRYALEYGIEHERAVLRWMDGLPWFKGSAQE